MLLLKYMLLLTGCGLFIAAAACMTYDLYEVFRIRLFHPEGPPPAYCVRWRFAGRLAALALLPWLLGLSVAIVPSGMGGVRVSQFSGTLAGVLYPGMHWIIPLIQEVELYDIRDQVLTTSGTEDAKKKQELLRVQSREGLLVGLTITVRYRLDPTRLDYIHATLPQPLDEEIILPVVTSVFRQIVPNYTVREVFSVKREEARRISTESITRKLAADGIVVKEVMLRDISLPADYAKGLEGLLLKEQENEKLAIEIEVKQKHVRTAELEAEADKVRQIKQAEAQAQVIVLQAKAQADAMQHTLPLKEKQIQQTRLEAEARKEATVKNAEAAAQAKVIDSKAELERRNLLSEAENHRIRLIAGADAERMRTEADVLKQNPLLIQKIIAERLSDKVQIMMVPMDGKFFFANDVLRGTPVTMGLPKPDQP
jgi:regulator of protease activity HflC (stomatin/prohibitin superfamily)